MCRGKKSFPEDRREAIDPHRGAKMAAPCSIHDLGGLLRGSREMLRRNSRAASRPGCGNARFPAKIRRLRRQALHRTALTMRNAGTINT